MLAGSGQFENDPISVNKVTGLERVCVLRGWVGNGFRDLGTCWGWEGEEPGSLFAMVPNY